MREKVKHYKGKEITPEVLKKMNLIELIRQKEGLTTFNIENVDTVEELCDNYDVDKEQINILLGQDWYLIYTTFKSEIEIHQWLSINNVKDKLIQTMEMFNEIKNILLIHKEKTIYSSLRHSTSYQFYKLLLRKEYIHEIDNGFVIADDIPEDLLSLIENRGEHFSTVEDYLEKEKKEEINDLPDFIFHDVVFEVSDKFIERYKKH